MLPLLALTSRPPPRVPLGTFPSPLEWRPDLAEPCGFEGLFVKRDDLNAEGLGGNKVRALEWILPTASVRVVSVGGFGSTHAAALAFHASRTGHQVSVALFPQPWTPWVESTLSRTAAHARVELARSHSRLPAALFRAWWPATRPGRSTWIPVGCASPSGVLGSVNAALEFLDQVKESDREPPDVVVVPLGSGGTAAGLWLGLQFAEWPVSICAVPVTSRLIANGRRVRWLAERTRRLLRRYGVQVPSRLPRLLVSAEHVGRGYGHPSEAGIRAQAVTGTLGLSLELTYGAKAFGALQALAGSYRRPCFWHTFDARTDGVVPAPEEILQRARAYSEALWPSPRST